MIKLMYLIMAILTPMDAPTGDCGGLGFDGDMICTNYAAHPTFCRDRETGSIEINIDEEWM